MKLSYRWLARHLPDLPAPEVLAGDLTRLGLEVDRYGTWGEELGSIRLVEVLARRPHPGADHLAVVTVDDGRNRVEVVTGARDGLPGQRVWWAPPGTRLPDGRTIGPATLRGVVSQGMLLSAAEAGFQAPGELWVHAGPEPPGTTLLELLGGPDTVYELELTPNLAAYAQSVQGVARELAALYGRPLPPEPPAFPGWGEGGPLAVEVEDPTACPLYTLVEWRVAGEDPAPLWMQALLRAVGQRPLGGVVDLTNFVLFGWGQPLHAFDADAVELPVRVCRARPGERLVTLDGVERVLDPADLVIADAGRVLGLAGVMGGLDSGVRPGTRRIYLESAHFAAPVVFRTLKRHDLASEAALRFGKGSDPALAPAGPALVAAYAGGLLEPTGRSARVGRVPEPPAVPWHPGRIRALLGVNWDDRRLEEALGRLGFRVSGGMVHAPSWRREVTGSHDLAEDVARLEGYEAVGERLPVGPTVLGARDAAWVRADRVRDLAAAAGYQELLTPSYTGPDAPADPVGGPEALAPIRIVNPLRDRESWLRTGLLATLREAWLYNRDRDVEPQPVFEVAPVYGRPGGGEAVAEPLTLAALLPLAAPEAWPGTGSLYQLKGLVELVAERLGWAVAFGPLEAEHPWFHPGRSLAILGPDGRRQGLLGELRAEFWAPARMRGRVAGLEWRLPLAVEPALPVIRHAPRFPAVVRDLSFVVPEESGWAEWEAVLAAARPPRLEAWRLMDRFRGGFGLSFTVRFTFRAPDRTLTDAEVDGDMARLMAALEVRGARVRGAST
ncbi:Phenylalanine--tRNA ligase beta subunit [Candidatus Hydrogenisulfobacillus filiaventi]|uniref:Phenylalanine--tRNA ligase beta subunit n=1 Tax=Candidatus Hydrogenisulfobacillus filiaventi TaxID=2707344 RepID=A0A6F8ZFH0_9FIRM|nr:Phenylalanine--tRNA ligase beta subunit [Candidatus Hydrogenisulfobacillus filiaventi]